MKLILLLLAFTLTAQGQIDTIRTIILYSDSNPDDSLFINGKWHHNVITGDRPSYSATAVATIDTSEILFRPITRDDLFRYERDCYADSTHTEGATFRDFEAGNHYWAEYHPKPWKSVANLLYLENRWTHREPTFQGFIQWMRKQR